MFSKLRRGKSEKQSETPQLRGMPALKQMRSSKRVENFSAKPLGPKKTEFERLQTSVNSAEFSYGRRVSDSDPASRRQPTDSSSNYNRPQSANLEQRNRQQALADHASYIESLSSGSPFSYEDRSRVMTDQIPEENEKVFGEDQESPAITWRFSKGDSGYKSKDEGSKDDKKGKKSRKKGKQGKERGKGLHTIKQERKASREERVSQSMRALTPKERESIQFLDEVLKDHSDGEDSEDEVFSETSSNDIEEVDESPRQTRLDDSIDNGYSSIRDNPRKYSMESISSVGSFIDLVGARPETSSPKSPGDDVTKRELCDSDVIMTDTMTTAYSAGRYSSDATLQSDATIDFEDVINQLDDVIHSFSNQSEIATDNESDRGSSRRRDSERDGVQNNWRSPAKSHEQKNSKKKKKSESSTEEVRRRWEEYSGRGDDQQQRESAALYAHIQPKNKQKISNVNGKTDGELIEPPTAFANHIPETESVARDELSRFENPPKTHNQHVDSGVCVLPTSVTSQKFSYLTPNIEPRDEAPKPTPSPTSPVSTTPDKSQKFSYLTPNVEPRDQTPKPTPTPTSPASTTSYYSAHFQPKVSNQQPEYSQRMRLTQAMVLASSRELRHVERRDTGKVLRVDPDHKKVVKSPPLPNPIRCENVYQKRETQITPKNVGVESRPRNERAVETEQHTSAKNEAQVLRAKNERILQTREQHTSAKDEAEVLRAQDERITEKRELLFNLLAAKNATQPKRVQTEGIWGTKPNQSDAPKSPPRSPEAPVDLNRNPVKIRNKTEASKKTPGRPVSLNLDQSGNLKLPNTDKPHSITIRPYSSFREEKVNPPQESPQKPRPFVIRPMKKPIQLY